MMGFQSPHGEGQSHLLSKVRQCVRAGRSPHDCPQLPAVGQMRGLTPHTAACIMASSPPSGASRFPEINCFPTSLSNFLALSVSERMCLKAKGGWHCLSLLGQGFCSFSGCVFTKGSTVLSTKEPNPRASRTAASGAGADRDQQESLHHRAWTIRWPLCTCPHPLPWHTLQPGRGRVTLPAACIPLQLCSSSRQQTVVPGSRARDRLTYAARRGGALQCPEQLPSQLLHLLQVIQHGVGEVHEVVEIYGVSHGPAKLHLKYSGLACGTGMLGSAAMLWLISCPITHPHWDPPLFRKKRGRNVGCNLPPHLS